MIYEVYNKKLLLKYQETIKKLKLMLIGKEENSIQTMIYVLNWNDTIYRTFNKGLAYTWKYGLEENLPKSLIEFIQVSHISSILAILRKLYERNQPIDKAVNSIPTILHLIKTNIGCWTRENYICYDGTPYDKKDSYTWQINYKIEYRHNRFDKMSGVIDIEKRKRNDKLLPSIITVFEKNANLNESLKNYVNKYLFHAAMKDNRPDENELFKNTTLLKIQNQMKKTIWLLLQICKIVDELVLTELAVPQFDQLEGWDKSIFNKKIKEKLRRYWEERFNLWDKWTHKYWHSDDIYITPNKFYNY